MREYQPGDDVRHIDWNVTARTNKPFIKNFREERELTVMLVVDISASSQFGSRFRSKKALIAEIGAVLAFSAMQNNDKVGLLLFSDIVEKYLPPRKGVKAVLRVIRELLAFEPKSKGTNISTALTFLGKIQKRGDICFLISDFISPDYSQALKLTAKRYDLISIQVTDPLEQNFPKMGLVQLTDLENNKSVLVDSEDPETTTYFKKLSESPHENLMKKLGAGAISIRTDQPYADALHHYFKKRRRKKS